MAMKGARGVGFAQIAVELTHLVDAVRAPHCPLFFD
jgi:hypothetical protein